MTNKRITDLFEITYDKLENADLATVVDVDESDPALKNRKIDILNLKTLINYISSIDATDLTDAGDTTLHYHQADRTYSSNNANQTGSPLTVSGSDPIININDIDLATIINRIRGNDGAITLESDANNVASDSQIKFFMDGNQSSSFKFCVSIGGHNLLHLRIGNDSILSLSSITHVTTTATATATANHNLTTGMQVAISGATPSQYNGTFEITVTTSTQFTYVMASDPGADATGTLQLQYLPICLIIGPNAPTVYSGLLDAVAYGTIFCKYTTTGANTSHLFSKGQGPTPGLLPQWRTISSA